MRALILPALLATLPLAAAPTDLRADPLSDRGRALAVRWCTACHVVEPGRAGGDAGPAFETLADRSEPGLRAWLFKPHPPMPDLNLTSDEIDAIIAWINTLE